MRDPINKKLQLVVQTYKRSQGNGCSFSDKRKLNLSASCGNETMAADTIFLMNVNCRINSRSEKYRT
jgi:hypothetical protein